MLSEGGQSISTKSYSPATAASAVFRRRSRCSSVTSSTSAPASSRLAPAHRRRSRAHPGGRCAPAFGHAGRGQQHVVHAVGQLAFVRPTPIVALPWGPDPPAAHADPLCQTRTEIDGGGGFAHPTLWLAMQKYGPCVRTRKNNRNKPSAPAAGQTRKRCMVSHAFEQRGFGPGRTQPVTWTKRA